MKKIYRVENLDCPCCANKMQTAMLKIEGVNDASLNVMTQKLSIDLDESNLECIMKAVLKACKKVDRDFEIIR